MPCKEEKQGTEELTSSLVKDIKRVHGVIVSNDFALKLSEIFEIDKRVNYREGK